VGRGGSETTLSERLPCGHTGAFHSSGAIPTAWGDRFEGQMQDGTVTTENSHGGVGLVGSLSTGSIPSWVQVYTLCRVLIYTYSRVLGHGQTLKACSFLMYWDFYLPL
jgi:hypothetical protein